VTEYRYASHRLAETAPARTTGRWEHRRFHKPVVVQPKRIDRDRVVTDTRVAAQVLRFDWQNTGCPKRLAALRACLQVLRGEKPPSHARRAFIAAAKAARILIDA